jgi:hypothetical protein
MKPSTVKIKKMPSRFKHQAPASTAVLAQNHAPTEFMKELKGTTG